MYKEENNTNVPQTLTRRQKRVGSIGKKKKNQSKESDNKKDQSKYNRSSGQMENMRIISYANKNYVNRQRRGN